MSPLLAVRVAALALLAPAALAVVAPAAPATVPAPARAAVASVSPVATVGGAGVRVLDVVLDDDGSASVVAERRLDRAPSQALLPDQQLASVAVRFASGQVVEQDVAVAGLLRSELPAVPGSTVLSHTRVPAPSPVVHVVVPAAATPSSITVRTPTRTYRAADARVVSRPAGLAPVKVPIAGYPVGPASNRLDIVVLGDGYTAAQQADFAADAKTLVDSVFSVDPYSSYRDFVNVVGLFVPSTQSGADHPAYSGGCSNFDPAPTCCPDNTATASATFVDTRYDSTFCSYGIERLLVPLDLGTIYADAAAYPQYDQVMMAVNDAEYGGSGGEIATASDNALAPQVLQHELGHSLLALDDEYDFLTPGYPPCSDYGRNGITLKCAPNVTDQTERSSVKWKRWIKPSTPVPTASPQPPSTVGLFLGAHYSPTTWYRPCDNCLMRNLGQPMGAVGNETMPLRLHAAPSKNGFGIDLVDPGSTKPATGAPVKLAAGKSRTFSVRVLSTEPAKGTKVTWTVDGKVVKKATVATGKVSYTFKGNRRKHVVKVVVQSLPVLLHPSKVGVSRVARTWQVKPAT